MLKKIKDNFVTKLICVFLVLNLVSCGTILYPERKGQTGGQLDPAIVVLDGIGLLLFFIPGVVAFAVDFSNGTIYLPGGQRSQLTPEEQEHISNMESRDEQLKHIGMLIRRKSDSPLFFDERDLQIKTVDDPGNIASLIEGHAGKLVSRSQ